MKHLLILFIILFSTITLAKVEIWECYKEGEIPSVYKLNTDVPSVAERENGKWEYAPALDIIGKENVVYDKESQNLNTNKGSYVWDLVAKEYFSWGKKYNCKVIGP